MTDLAPQLRSLESELSDVRARAHRLADGLTAGDWSRRPEPERWSIGEQIVHLNLTSRAFLPRLEEAVRGARERGLVGEGPYRRDLLGWLLGTMMEPPVRLRVKTTAPFVPSFVEPREAAMRGFDGLQEELAAFVRRAAGLALGQIKVVSPFNARVRYNLYASLRMIPAHQRRHLWLGERLRAELGRAAAV